MAEDDQPGNVVQFRTRPPPAPALTVTAAPGNYQEAYTIVMRRQTPHVPGDVHAILDGPLRVGRPLMTPEEMRSVAEDLEALAIFLRNDADHMQPDQPRRYVGQLKVFTDRHCEWGLQPYFATASSASWLEHVVMESLQNLVANLRKIR